MADKQIKAFIGRAGSGKDYQCKLLEEKGFKHLAFADALRDIAFTIFDLDQEIAMEHYDILKSSSCVEFKDYDNKHSLWQHKQLNFRQILENLGTQGIRKYDEDFWIRCITNQIEKNNYEQVCISDMRYANEFLKIKEWCEEHGYEFTCTFCDYHSDRYQEINTHESALLSNWLCEQGYKDLQELTEKDIFAFQEFVRLIYNCLA